MEAALIARDLAGRRGLVAGTAWHGWSISVREDAGSVVLDLLLAEAAAGDDGNENNDNDHDRSNIIVFPGARHPRQYNGRSSATF